MIALENKITNRIREHILYVLEHDSSQAKVKDHLDSIHSIFKELTNISGFDYTLEHLAAVSSSKGKALGLNYAAQCLLDYNRTSTFIKGIVLAIRNKQKSSPNTPIQLLYVGCGPYATLATLIAPLFDPEDIQFTLLEINQLSLNTALKLINDLSLEAYFTKSYCEDAVTYQIPEANQFHIIISETLDALLYRESYVPIVFNLISQCHKTTTIIPHNVIVTLSLSAEESTSELNKETFVDTIFNVREALKRLHSLPSQIEAKTIYFNSYSMADYSKVILDTKVHVYKELWLERHESSLTLPLTFTLEQPFTYNTMHYHYQIDPNIELKFALESYIK